MGWRAIKKARDARINIDVRTHGRPTRHVRSGASSSKKTTSTVMSSLRSGGVSGPSLGMRGVGWGAAQRTCTRAFAAS